MQQRGGAARNQKLLWNITWKAQPLELPPSQKHPKMSKMLHYSINTTVAMPPIQPSYHRKRHVNTQEGDGAAPSAGRSLNRTSLEAIQKRPKIPIFLQTYPYQNSESVNTEVSLSIFRVLG